MTPHTRITTPFDRETTADEVLARLDLTGHRAIVTEGASGIGAETARALATAGAEVTLCTVTGGGHAWPGGAFGLPGTTQNISATDAMWTFFSAHPMP